MVKEEWSGFFPNLELTRGFAAILVVIHHVYNLSNSNSETFGWFLESAGSIGVILFFVLSSFLLSYQLLSSKLSLRDFYRRRFFRIAPAYYFMLFVIYVFYADPNNIWSKQGIAQSLSNLFFLQHFSPYTVSNLNTNGALWTLSIEATLYLFLPIFVYFIKKNFAATFAIIFVIGIFYRYMVQNPFLEKLYFGNTDLNANQIIFIQQQFLGWLPVFGFGMSIAFLRMKFGSIRGILVFNKFISVFFLILVIFAGKLTFQSSDVNSIWFIYYSLLVGLLSGLFVFFQTYQLKKHSNTIFKFGYYLGARSYSIYLWHFPIILRVLNLSPNSSFSDAKFSIPRLFLISLLILLISEFSYRFIEQPAIRYAKTYTSKK